MEDSRKSLEGLSYDELLAEVRLCHEHFQRCCDALDGNDDVEPVTLVDVSDSADLELFYKCKRIGSMIQKTARGERAA